MTRNDPKFIGCGCAPGEFLVVASAEKDGTCYEVMGAGQTPEAAEADAEDHAFTVLGDDAIIRDRWTLM
jgi:hypothetical protein